MYTRNKSDVPSLVIPGFRGTPAGITVLISDNILRLGPCLLTNDLSARKTVLQTLRCGIVTLDLALGVDVTNVRGDT